MPTPPEARLHDVEVVDNGPVAADVFRLVVKAPELARALKPGQFVDIAVPGDATQLVRIPVAYSGASPREGTVDIVFAVVGDGTRRLSRLLPGTTLNVLGPCGGHGWSFHEGQGRGLLVAGGVGTTPLMSLARALGSAGIPFDVVVGAQTAAKLWGIDEFKEVGAGSVFVTTDDGTRGRQGFTTTVVGPLLAERGYERVYACGPEVMMAGIATLAAAADVECQVSMERMMTCGFGACNTCNVALVSGGYAGACTAGPVFDAREVAW